MIRVLIDRYFAPGTDDELRKVELQARQEAIRMPGYISGETLRDTSNPQHNIVISTWRSRQEWDAWMASQAREKLALEIAALLIQPEQITVLEPL